MRQQIGANGAGNPDPPSIERLEEVISALDRPDQYIEQIAMSFILKCRIRLADSTCRSPEVILLDSEEDSKPRHALKNSECVFTYAHRVKSPSFQQLPFAESS